MSLFHALRSSHRLIRLALLWFALTLGAAVASPAIHPQVELVICSGVGLQKVLINADGTESTSAESGISCPLGLMAGAPPPAAVPGMALVRGVCHGVPSMPMVLPGRLCQQATSGARSSRHLTPNAMHDCAPTPAVRVPTLGAIAAAHASH